MFRLHVNSFSPRRPSASESRLSRDHGYVTDGLPLGLGREQLPITVKLLDSQLDPVINIRAIKEQTCSLLLAPLFASPNARAYSSPGSLRAKPVEAILRQTTHLAGCFRFMHVSEYL